MLIMLGISNSVFMYVAVLISCYVVISARNLSDYFGLLLFLLPFSNVFVKGNYGGYPFLLLLMIVSFFKISIINRSINYLYFICLFLLVMDVLILSIAGLSIPVRGQIIIFGCLLVAAVTLYKERIDVVFLSRSYALGVLLAILLAIFSSYIPNLTNYTYHGYYVFKTVERFCGLYKNPNYFTFDITICTSSLLYVSSITNKRTKFDIVLIIALCISGCLSVSMSFVLSIILMMMCYFLFSKNGHINYKAMGITSVLAIVLFVIFKSTPVLSAIMTRMSDFDFSSDGLSSTTTLRSDIWKVFLQVIFSDIKIFLFGAGLNSTTASAHNFYIEYWYFFGLVGYILLIAFIILTINKIKMFTRRNRFNKQILIVIIPLIFRAFGISLVAFMNFWLAICLIIAMLKNDENLNAIEQKRQRKSDYLL